MKKEGFIEDFFGRNCHCPERANSFTQAWREGIRGPLGGLTVCPLRLAREEEG